MTTLLQIHRRDRERTLKIGQHFVQLQTVGAFLHHPIQLATVHFLFVTDSVEQSSISKE